MISLGYIAPDDWPSIERLRVSLERLLIDTGRSEAIGIRFGTGTVTFTASRVSASTAVTHGLGRTPVVVFVMDATDHTSHVVAFSAFSYTSTQFTTRGDFTDGTAATGGSAFVWVAIG